MLMKLHANNFAYCILEWLYTKGLDTKFKEMDKTTLADTLQGFYAMV